jgi:hypothetical protein
VEETNVKMLGALALAAALLLSFVSPAAAEGVPIGATAPTILKTFRLQVTGRPPAGTTFWVAYGPLAGRFGIIQLRPAGRALYVATRRLPAHGRTTFVYIAGHGTIRARFGPAPGNPVATIQVLNAMPVSRETLPVVQYQVPLG